MSAKRNEKIFESSFKTDQTFPCLNFIFVVCLVARSTRSHLGLCEPEHAPCDWDGSVRQSSDLRGFLQVGKQIRILRDANIQSPDICCLL